MPYVPHTAADTEAMLSVIGAKSIDELFREIPANLKVAPGTLNIPPALDEQRLFFVHPVQQINGAGDGGPVRWRDLAVLVKRGGHKITVEGPALAQLG